MSVKRHTRSFSLYDSQRKRQMGGRKSGFSRFLASIGHATRPILRDVERGLVGWGKQKLAKKIGGEAVQFGSDLLKSVAEGKSLQSAAQSAEGRELLRKGLKTGWDHIKGLGGGGSVGLPPDINHALTQENREALQDVLSSQPRQRRRRRSRKRSVARKPVVRKKRAGSAKKSKKGAGRGKKSKKGAGKGRARKKGGARRTSAVKSKKAGSKSRKKTKSVRFKKGVGKRKAATKKTGGKRKKSILKKGGGPKSIFD